MAPSFETTTTVVVEFWCYGRKAGIGQDQITAFLRFFNLRMSVLQKTAFFSWLASCLTLR